MAEFLELPDREGMVVDEGVPVPEGQQRPQRNAPFLAPEKQIPTVEGWLKQAERPSQKVINARKKKERDAVNRKQTSGAGGSASQPKKRNKKVAAPEAEASVEPALDVDPLNQAHPSDPPVQEQVNAEAQDDHAADNIG